MTKEKQHQTGDQLRLSPLFFQYIKLLDSFFVAAFFIPVFYWLVLTYLYSDLQKNEYKHVLKSHYISPMVYFFIFLFIRGVSNLVLTKQNVHLTTQNETGRSVFNSEKTYYLLANGTILQKITILINRHANFLVTFTFGWFIFGGIIYFFSVSWH